jgi:glucose-6-phosphate isomerase
VAQAAIRRKPGEGQKRLFPASASFSGDLHSLGQFIQEGSRILFETALVADRDTGVVEIQKEEKDYDGLNYLAGKTLGEIQDKAVRAVASAHQEGGTPSIIFRIPNRSPYEYGWMLYFFEFACAVGGYMLGMNPFDHLESKGINRTCIPFSGGISTLNII